MHPLLLFLSLSVFGLWRLSNSKTKNPRRQLDSHTRAFVAELRNREESITAILSSCARKSELKKTSANLYHIGVIRGLDDNPKLRRRVEDLLSLSTQLAAELRAWQQAAHVLACIDSALAYISRTRPQAVDTLRDTMINSILAFPPVTAPGSAQPQADDCERIMDRRVLFDEPHMQAFIWSLNTEDRIAMQAAADRERAHLPLFPAALLEWEPFDSLEVTEQLKKE